LFDPTSDQMVVLDLTASDGVEIDDSEPLCKCILEAAGLGDSEDPDKEAREFLNKAIHFRLDAVRDRKEKSFDVRKLESAMEFCGKAHKVATTDLVKNQVKYETGLCNNALRLEAQANHQNDQYQFERAAETEFEASEDYPLSIMELGKLRHSKYYETSKESFLYQAIEKYKEALDANVDYYWPNDRRACTKVDTCYHLGSAYLECSLVAQNQHDKYDFLKNALTQFQQAEDALKSFFDAKTPSSISRKENPTFEDLQAAYNHGTVLKEIGIVEKGKDKWKNFNRAINILKVALPQSKKWPSLRKDILLLIGACYHMSYKEQVTVKRKANKKLLESAANAYRVAYALDSKGMSAAIACYNLGNVLYEKSDFQNAVIYYKKSIQILEKNGISDSSFEEDLRFNLEIAEKEVNGGEEKSP